MSDLILQRNVPTEVAGYSTAYATHGELALADGSFACVTLENPWLSNQRTVSCIPAGRYVLRKRRSPIVERTSGGEFLYGWEVTGVSDRTFIMIHPGNYARNTEGCILVGRRVLDIDGDGELDVTHSRETFRELMIRLDVSSFWVLDIRWPEGFSP